MKQPSRGDRAVSFTVNVLAAESNQNLGRLGGSRSGSHGDDRLAFVKLSLIKPGFGFAHAQSSQGSENSTDSHAGNRAAEKAGYQSPSNRHANRRDQHGGGGGQHPA